MDNKEKQIEYYKDLREKILASVPFEIGDDDSKIAKVVSSIAAFKATNYKGTNKQLAEITGISKSSIQRYLTDQKLVEMMVGENIYTLIKTSLEQNKIDGKIKGGINSIKNNSYFKDESGRFTSKSR